MSVVLSSLASFANHFMSLLSSLFFQHLMLLFVFMWSFAEVQSLVSTMSAPRASCPHDGKAPNCELGANSDYNSQVSVESMGDNCSHFLLFKWRSSCKHLFSLLTIIIFSYFIIICLREGKSSRFFISIVSKYSSSSCPHSQSSTLFNLLPKLHESALQISPTSWCVAAWLFLI